MDMKDPILGGVSDIVGVAHAGFTLNHIRYMEGCLACLEGRLACFGDCML